MARPFEKLPPGAKTHLEAMAESGLLSESAAAQALGMPLNQFRTVIRTHEPSREIWDISLAVERDQLLKAMYGKAVDGDTRAAQTLLAVRHGLSEKHTPVTVDIDKDASPADAGRAIVAAAASGQMPADVAATLMRVLGDLAKLIEAGELQGRIERLEELLNEQSD